MYPLLKQVKMRPSLSCCRAGIRWARTYSNEYPRSISLTLTLTKEKDSKKRRKEETQHSEVSEGLWIWRGLRERRKLTRRVEVLGLHPEFWGFRSKARRCMFSVSDDQKRNQIPRGKVSCVIRIASLERGSDDGRETNHSLHIVSSMAWKSCSRDLAPRSQKEAVEVWAVTERKGVGRNNS